MEKSESIVKLAAALVAAQKDMPGAVEDAQNPFFKSTYADLNSVREACTPSLNRNGVCILQPTVQKDGKNYVRTMLLHSSGEYLACDTEVVVTKQNDPQAHGSAISYARRYGLNALLSLGTRDDDAEGAHGRFEARHHSETSRSSSVSDAVKSAQAAVKANPVVIKPNAEPKGFFDKEKGAKLKELRERAGKSAEEVQEFVRKEYGLRISDLDQKSYDSVCGWLNAHLSHVPNDMNPFFEDEMDFNRLGGK